MLDHNISQHHLNELNEKWTKFTRMLFEMCVKSISIEQQCSQALKSSNIIKCTLLCLCSHKMDSNVPWNWMQNASQTKGFSLAWVFCKCIKSFHFIQHSKLLSCSYKKTNLLSCSKLNDRQVQSPFRYLLFGWRWWLRVVWTLLDPYEFNTRNILAPFGIQFSRWINPVNKFMTSTWTCLKMNCTH